MSLRLYLARLTVWLLVMLSGYGVTQAQTLTGVIPGSSTVCGGTTVTLNPQFVGAPSSGTVTYRVLNTGGVDVPGSPVVVTAATNPSFVFNDFPVPVVSGQTTLTITGSYANGSTSSGPVSATLLVNPSPTAPISVSASTNPICAGGTSTITVPSGLTIANAAGPAFLPFSGVPTEALSVTASPTASGVLTFTLAVSNEYSCSISTTTSLTVQNPGVSLASSSTVLNCATAPVTLTALSSSSGFPASTTFAFSGGNTGDQTGTSSTYSLSVPAAGTTTPYVVTVVTTTPAGCTATASYTVAVDTSVPAGPSVTFTAPSSGTLDGAVVDATSSITGISATVCQNSSLLMSVSGCVTGTPSTTTIQNPAIVIVGPFNSTVTGATTVTSVSGGGIATYQIPTTALTGVDAPFVYNVYCTGTNGCQSTAVASLTLTVNPTPAAPSLTVTGGSNLTGNTVVAAGGAGAVATCSTTSSLTVTTSCVLSTTGATGGPATVTVVSGTGSTSATVTSVTANGGGTTFGTFTIPISASGTTVYQFVCNNATCASAPTTLTVTVNAIPAPVSASSLTGVTCQAASTTATTTLLNLCATGQTAVVTGSTAVTGSGRDVIIPTGVAGVYSYSVACQSTAGCSSSATAGSYTVNAATNNASLTVAGSGLASAVNIAGGQSNAVTVCQGTSLTVTTDCVVSTGAVAGGTNTLTAIGGTTGGTASATATSGTVATGSGTGVGSTTASYATFIVGTDNAVTTVYSFVCSTSAGCTSFSATSLTVTVNSTPTPVSASSLTGVTCQASSPTATTTLSNVCATGQTAVVSGTGATGSGPSVIVPIGIAGVYNYSVACQSSLGCSSSATPGSFTVNPAPNNAALTVAGSGLASAVNVPAGAGSSVVVCQGTSLTVSTDCVVSTGSTTGSTNTLTAVGGTTGGAASATVTSGTVATGTGTGVGSGTASYATFLLGTDVVTTTVYSFVCSTTAGCQSFSATSLTVTVNSTPPAPDVTLASSSTAVCLNTPLSYTVTNCPTGSSLTTTSAGLSIAGTVITVNTSVTTTDAGTAYSVSCVTGACISPATPFTVVVNPLPNNASLTALTGANVVLGTIPAVGPGSVTVCQFQSLTISTDCLINTGSTGGSSNTLVGNASAGTAGSAVAGPITPTSTTMGYAQFVVSTTATGTFTYTLACVNSSSCTSPQATTFNVTVQTAPANATVAYAGDGLVSSGTSPALAGTPTDLTICAGNPVALTVTGCVSDTAAGTGTAPGVIGAPGSPQIIIGGSTSTNGASGAQLYTIPTSTTGLFSYSFVCSNGSCQSGTAVVLNVTVNGKPNGPTVTSSQTLVSGGSTINATSANAAGTLNVCQNAPLSLTVSGCVAGTQGSVTTVPVTGSANNSTILTTSATSGTSGDATYALSTSATGTQTYTILCTNNSGCSSPTVAVLTVNVLARPASATVAYAYAGGGAASATVSATTVSLTVCQTNPINLTVTGCASDTQGSPSSVTNLIGTTGGPNIITGGTTMGSGASAAAFYQILTPTSGNFSYTITCQNPATGCFSETATVINVQVNDTPATPTITLSGGTSATTSTGFSVTVCQNFPLSLTAACAASSLTATGTASSTVLPALTPTASKLTISSIADTTATGTYTYSLICTNSSSCSSTVTTVAVRIIETPANATVVATAVGSNTAASSPASPLTFVAGGSNSITVCAGTSIVGSLTGCPTTTSSGTTTTPPSPDTSGSGFNVGGTQVASNSTNPNSFTVNTAGLSGTYVYTVNCTNSNQCTSATVTAFTVTVNPTPQAPTLANVVANGVTQVCLNTSTTLNSLTAIATCGTGLTAIVTTSAGVALSTAANSVSYVVPNSAAGLTGYQVICTNSSSCSSTPTSFSVNVNSIPETATIVAVGGGQTATSGISASAIAVCQGTSLTLTVNGCVTAAGTPGDPLVIGGSNGNINIGGGTSGTGSSLSAITYTVNTDGVAPGVYSITTVCTNAAGCSSSVVSAISLTINQTPTTPTTLASNRGTITAGQVVSLCAGDVLSVTATCPSGSTATYNNVGGANVITGDTTVTGVTIPTASSGLTSYTVACVQGTCQSGIFSFTTTVSPIPASATVTASSGPGNTISGIVPGSPQGLTVCPGSVVSLTVNGCTPPTTGANPIQIGGGGPIVIGGIGQITSGTDSYTTVIPTTGIATGTYNITLACVNTAGCQGTSLTSFSLTISGTPTSASLVGFAPTCSGASAVTGTASCETGNVFVQYTSWPTSAPVGSFTASPTSTSTGSATFNTDGFAGTTPNLPAGIYVVNVQCGLNPTCLGPVQTLTINNSFSPAPPVSVEALRNTVCPGQSTTLVATGCTSGTITWYQVASPTNTSVGSGPSVVVSPTGVSGQTLYFVATCKLNTCESTPTTQVGVTILPSVQTIPAISAQPNPTVAGAPVTLSAFGCPTGTQTVFYSDAAGTVEVGRTITSSIVVNPTTSTTYYAACFNNVCRGPLTTGVLVQVNSCNFTATVTPSSATLCPGGSVILTASGGSSYVWSNGAGNVQQITVQAPGTYSVIVTSAQGCTAVASAVVVPGMSPTPAISGNSTIFQGQTAVLTATGGVSYMWSNGSMSPTISTQTAGVYTVTVTGPSGCTASASVTVTVNPLPAAPSVTPGTNLATCLGSPVLLSASCQAGTPRFNYGNASFNQSTYSVDSPIAGPVSLNVVCVVNGMEGAATPVTVTFNQSPSVSISGNPQICVTNGVVTGATLTASGATSYLWSNGATTPTITVTATGVYSVTGTTAGCSNVAQVTTTSAVCGTGQPLVITGASINCNTREITITTSGGNGQPVERMIQLVTMWVPQGQPLLLDAAILADANNSVVQLYVRQNGTVVGPFAFNFRTTCPAGGGTTTPPPTSTTTATGNTITVCGQPYTLTGDPFSLSVGFQCNPGTTPHNILFFPSGGQVDPNSVIEFMSIGITPWTQSCTETFDLNNTDNSTFTIFARQRNTQTGAILATTQVTVTSPCQRKDAGGREAISESGELDVTVLGNPTLSDKVEVEVRGAEGQRLQLRMTNGQGSSVSEVSVDKAGAVERQTIGLGRSAGMYFLQVITPTKVKTVKVVRQ